MALTESDLVKKHAPKQGSRVSCLAQIGIAAFVNSVQLLISGSTYAEAEQISQLSSFSGVFTTPVHG